jgi:hypothetical protein
MTRVEFDRNLDKINFMDGANTHVLEDYLLSCLDQLEIYKPKEPSYELFLLIFDQARNGPKKDFDLSWKELYNPQNKSKLNDLSGWERATNELRFLVTDLVHTREVRSRPDYIERKMWPGEWDTEGGVRFYNGTTISAILGYAATRFESEYPPMAFQERKVNWEEFTYPIWIGISYE